MLKIHMHTGTAWTKIIETEGTLNDDLMAIIEGYVIEHKDEFACFTYEELMEDEEDETYLNEMFLPINGGEYYIYTVSHVEEV